MSMGKQPQREDVVASNDGVAAKLALESEKNSNINIEWFILDAVNIYKLKHANALMEY